MKQADMTLIERRLSVERLSPYRAAMSGDLDRAIALYRWNAEVAAAFWTLIGHVEVLARNAMHERLQAWSVTAVGHTRWYTALGYLFNAETNQDIATHSAVSDVLARRPAASRSPSLRDGNSFRGHDGLRGR